MTQATLTISREERDVLHGLMCRRLFILGMEPIELARKEGVAVEEVAESFGEDLRLMNDLGWEFEGTSSSAELTMPADGLAKTVKRLRRDARRAPCESRHEREPDETDDERWRRFREGVEVCEALLQRLDSPPEPDDEPQPISGVSPEQAAQHELGPYTPVTDGFALAAVERAVLHEQEDSALTSAVVAHLGFDWGPPTNQFLFPRLEELQHAGLLTNTPRRGGEPFWSLTTVGRERLDHDREAGEVGDLPESPQHRAWRHARVQAAVRIDQFRGEQTQALEAAYELTYRYQPSMSAEWFLVAERLRWTTWRMASAIYCLYEWPEPDDEFPDVDQNPGPRPGRRAISAWGKAP
jgi:hypothetical protein